MNGHHTSTGVCYLSQELIWLITTMIFATKRLIEMWFFYARVVGIIIAKSRCLLRERSSRTRSSEHMLIHTMD